MSPSDDTKEIFRKEYEDMATTFKNTDKKTLQNMKVGPDVLIAAAYCTGEQRYVNAALTLLENKGYAHTEFSADVYQKAFADVTTKMNTLGQAKLPITADLFLSLARLTEVSENLNKAQTVLSNKGFIAASLKSSTHQLSSLLSSTGNDDLLESFAVKDPLKGIAHATQQRVSSDAISSQPTKAVNQEPEKEHTITANSKPSGKARS